MQVRFHEAALAELAWEVQYYAKISPQLGKRFATMVERALAIAAEFPVWAHLTDTALAEFSRNAFHFRSCTYTVVMKFWCWQSHQTTGSQAIGVLG